MRQISHIVDRQKVQVIDALLEHLRHIKDRVSSEREQIMSAPYQFAACIQAAEVLVNRLRESAVMFDSSRAVEACSTAEVTLASVYFAFQDLRRGDDPETSKTRIGAPLLTLERI
jgi:hypothetical protein